MANIGGYTNIPDNLIDAQNMIVNLLNELKVNSKSAYNSEKIIDEETNEILKDRQEIKDLQQKHE